MLVQGTGFNLARPDNQHFRIVFLPHEDDLREAIEVSGTHVPQRHAKV